MSRRRRRKTKKAILNDYNLEWTPGDPIEHLGGTIWIATLCSVTLGSVLL